MTQSDTRILIVADDNEIIATLTHRLVTELDADVTVVDSIRGAGLLADGDSFDVIIFALDPADSDDRGLLPFFKVAYDTPRILLGGRVDGPRILSAFRAGMVDVLPDPIDFDRLSAVVRQTVRDEHSRKHQLARTRRLRRISSRLIRDRRELRQRVDLICRDLVTAYRRLAHKVVASQHAEADTDQSKRLDSFSPNA